MRKRPREETGSLGIAPPPDRAGKARSRARGPRLAAVGVFERADGPKRSPVGVVPIALRFRRERAGQVFCGVTRPRRGAPQVAVISFAAASGSLASRRQMGRTIQ